MTGEGVALLAGVRQSSRQAHASAVALIARL
jgi:hypothetical protein